MKKMLYSVLLLVCFGAFAYSQQSENGLIDGSDAPATPVPIPNLQLPTHAVKWQYKRLEGNPSEQDLNALGDESWELAGMAQKNFTTIYVFKRMKQ